MFVLLFIIQFAYAVTPDNIEQWMDSIALIITGPAYCSGAVIDNRGTVVTAYHCIATGQTSLVQLEDGTTGFSKIVAVAPEADLALLEVSEFAGKVPPLSIRQDTVRRGEVVYGLGHPFAPLAERNPLKGLLRWSVTKGIVSVVSDRFIQTDVPLNPGNSGGPIVDQQGQIVGIASRKLDADNISFLTPAHAIEKMKSDKKPMRIISGQFILLSSYDTFLSLGGSSAFTFGVGAAIRDRLLFSAGYSFDFNSSSTAWRLGTAVAPSFFTSASLRQRFGRGVVSSTIDIGGGGYVVNRFQREDDFVFRQPKFGGGGFVRIGFGGAGFKYGRIWLVDETIDWISLDLDSGVFGFF